MESLGLPDAHLVGDIQRVQPRTPDVLRRSVNIRILGVHTYQYTYVRGTYIRGAQDCMRGTSGVWYIMMFRVWDAWGVTLEERRPA